jgi:hypothetical protein
VGGGETGRETQTCGVTAQIPRDLRHGIRTRTEALQKTVANAHNCYVIGGSVTRGRGGRGRPATVRPGTRDPTGRHQGTPQQPRAIHSRIPTMPISRKRSNLSRSGDGHTLGEASFLHDTSRRSTVILLINPDVSGSLRIYHVNRQKRFCVLDNC